MGEGGQQSSCCANFEGAWSGTRLTPPGKVTDFSIKKRAERTPPLLDARPHDWQGPPHMEADAAAPRPQQRHSHTGFPVLSALIPTGTSVDRCLPLLQAAPPPGDPQCSTYPSAAAVCLKSTPPPTRSQRMKRRSDSQWHAVIPKKVICVLCLTLAPAMDGPRGTREVRAIGPALFAKRPTGSLRIGSPAWPPPRSITMAIFEVGSSSQPSRPNPDPGGPFAWGEVKPPVPGPSILAGCFPSRLSCRFRCCSTHVAVRCKARVG